MSPDELRLAFLMRLTQDSETKDRRRRDYNQAIFIPEHGSQMHGGAAVFSGTDLFMVMDAFDRAVKDLERR
jgi:hypothetical protein